jgi:hypothetical protein
LVACPGNRLGLVDAARAPWPSSVGTLTPFPRSLAHFAHFSRLATLVSQASARVGYSRSPSSPSLHLSHCSPLSSSPPCPSSLPVCRLWQLKGTPNPTQPLPLLSIGGWTIFGPRLHPISLHPCVPSSPLYGICPHELSFPLPFSYGYVSSATIVHMFQYLFIDSPLL